MSAFQPAIAADRDASDVWSLTTGAIPTSIDAPAAPAAIAATHSTRDIGGERVRDQGQQPQGAPEPHRDQRAVAVGDRTPERGRDSVVAAAVMIPMTPTSESDRSSRSTLTIA